MKSFYLTLDDLNKILDYFKSWGYKVLGPVIKDGAILYDEVEDISELPIGWTDEQSGGSYRLRKRDDNAVFGYTVGPHSWKRFLYPPVSTLWEAKRRDGTFEICESHSNEEKFVFLGVRSCEISAILIQDKIFSGGEYVDPGYIRRRNNTFLIAVNCNEPGNNCFCLSTGTGPVALTGYDIALTEVISSDEHYFIAVAGSEDGEKLLTSLNFREAESLEIEKAKEVANAAVSKFKRDMDLTGVVEILQENYEDPLWDEVSKKCLTCGNCTMVCPTCFCHTVEDVTDLTGQTARRIRRWDSCFTMEFSYIHGGSLRSSTLSRYRQWMMHKLSTWKNQFGMIGCVGCGRCITWCPVGIDIVENFKLFKNKVNKI